MRVSLQLEAKDKVPVAPGRFLKVCNAVPTSWLPAALYRTSCWLERPLSGSDLVVIRTPVSCVVSFSSRRNWLAGSVYCSVESTGETVG